MNQSNRIESIQYCNREKKHSQQEKASSSLWPWCRERLKGSVNSNPRDFSFFWERDRILRRTFALLLVIVALY
jgi:hypothetical protein